MEPTSLEQPEEYKLLLQSLKNRIAAAQTQATLAVNREVVMLYWNMGRDILFRQTQFGWGSKVIAQLSQDLQRFFPGRQGFSTRTLGYMRAFAEANSEEKAVSEVFAHIPWSDNVVLLDKVKEAETRLWYARMTIEHGWSRVVLAHQIESRLHERQGRAVTNFTHTLPQPQSELAQQILKDPYLFDFLTLRDKAVERELEAGLLTHLRDFLLELGTGFAFLGSQVQMTVSDKDYFLDLLFYHVRLHCYIVVELKMVDFEPEFAGKMNFYLAAVDNQLRNKERDEPSIGLILCKSRDRLIVEYALYNTTTPIGVAGYQLAHTLPNSLRDSLPTIAELEAKLTNLSQRASLLYKEDEEDRASD